MTDDVITVHRKDGWAEIAINRPERRNAIIPPVSHAIRTALIELEDDDDVEVVMIRGEGGFFCSGIDLKALQADPPPDWAGDTEHWRDLHLRLFRFGKPVIGALEKYAINAGAALALACDVIVAGETSFIQVGEIQQGTAAPMNAAWLKIKATEHVMARLVLYGDRVPAPAAKDLGLVTEVTADDNVVARARELCQQIASHPSGAGKSIKHMIARQRGITDPDSFFQRPGGRGLKGAKMLKE